jgi:hypothetical protein
VDENVVTCDYSVPLTVRVNIKTEQVEDVWLHLDSFQSSPSGRFQKIGGDLVAHFRDAFLEGGEFVDGEHPIGDRALAIADRVRISNPEFPLEFVLEESATGEIEEGEKTKWLVTTNPSAPFTLRQGYLKDAWRVEARNPLEALDLYSRKCGFAGYTDALIAGDAEISMGFDEHGLWATFTNYTIWAIPDKEDQ